MKTAVLGMGRMGRALASRLLDTDHHVTVWNRTRGPADELTARGVTEAADPRAEGVEIPLAAAVHNRYQAAIDAGLGGADIGAVVELLR